MDPNTIKNKIKRKEVYHKLKSEKNREKLKKRLGQKQVEKVDPSLKEQRLKENVPQTLETLRELDETLVGDDTEVFEEQETDEFASYFNGTTPKLLITTSKRPSASVYEFANEFKGIFPDAEFVKRYLRLIKWSSV
jgi:ribosome production factor 1